MRLIVCSPQMMHVAPEVALAALANGVPPVHRIRPRRIQLSELKNWMRENDINHMREVWRAEDPMAASPELE